MENNLKRKPFTNFIEGPDDVEKPNLTFLQTPNDPGGGRQDQPGAFGSNGTIFNTQLIPDTSGATLYDIPRILQATRETIRHEEAEREPTRWGADRAWDLYHGRYDFGEKEPWQSQRVSPKVFTAVERIISTVLRIKEKAREWFDVEALTESSQIYYNTVKHLLRFYLDHDAVMFDKELRSSCKSGLLSHMMYMLVVWENDGQIEVESTREGASNSVTSAEGFGLDLNLSSGSPTGGLQDPVMPGKTQSKLRIQALNPDYVYLDSTGSNRYKAWKVRYTKGEALREGRIRGWDMDALQRALSQPGHNAVSTPSTVTFHETRDARKQDKLLDYKPSTKVDILNYFGDLYDQNTGEIIAENVYYIVANDSQIVYGPVENPFWDGEDPIIAAPFTEVPFAAYGRSPLIQNLDMFESWNEFYNLMMDYFQSVLLGVKEIDYDLTDEFNQDIDNLFPGQVIKTRKRGQTNSNAVQNVPFSDIPPGLMQFMPVLQKEISDNIMLSDTIGGAPRTRGRITAMEDARRSADAGAMVEFIFNAIQDNLLAPVIRKSFYRILQFMPQKMWEDWISTHSKVIQPKDPRQLAEWDKVYEEMKRWTPEQRWNKLAGFFKFKVRIFSALGDKQAEIEKATFFIQSISSIPNVAALINWPRFLRKLAIGFDWDPEEILDLSQVPNPAQSTPTGETHSIRPDQLQEEAGGDNIGPGSSLGAPTSISTNPPFIPGNSDGVPGRRG